jgi:hypothetical protein
MRRIEEEHLNAQYSFAYNTVLFPNTQKSTPTRQQHTTSFACLFDILRRRNSSVHVYTDRINTQMILSKRVIDVLGSKPAGGAA